MKFPLNKTYFKIPIKFLYLNRFIISILFIVCFHFQIAYPKNPTVKLAASTWSPYTLEELPDQGLLSTVIKAALKTQGYETNIIFLPSARAPIETKNGTYSGYFPSYECDNKDFQKSTSLGKSIMGFAISKEKNITWHRLKNLKGKVIGNVRDRLFTEEFKNLSDRKILTVEESNTDLVNLKKLLYNRIDLVVIEKNIFDYLVAITPEFKEKFIFENKYIINRPLYICFNKNNKGKNIKKYFNIGLSKINKEDIIFQYIMFNY